MSNGDCPQPGAPSVLKDVKLPESLAVDSKRSALSSTFCVSNIWNISRGGGIAVPLVNLSVVPASGQSHFEAVSLLCFKVLWLCQDLSGVD